MNKIKQLWTFHKREIIVGVVVSIITTGLWSIITWFVREAPQIGTNLFEYIRNIFYRLAATCTGSSLSEQLLSMLTGVCFGVLFKPIFYFVKYIKQKTKKENRITINEDSKNEEQTNTNRKKKADKQRALLISTIITPVILFVFITAGVFIPSDIYKHFNRDITMISPYVEQEVIVQLESKWVLMKSYEDYKDIYSTINKVKDNHNFSK